MKTLPLEETRAGMVLAADLYAPDGRILLKAGTLLDETHLNGLGRRGVGMLQVVDDSGEEEANAEDVAVLETSQEYVHPYFEFVDPDHPALQELYRICVLRTAAAIQQGMRPPMHIPRADAAAENMIDLFLKEEGTAEDLVQHEVKLASFPDVYYQIISVLRSPTASADTIAQVVSQDPSLSAKLLKLVNSPFYGFPSTIDALPRAVALVGNNELSTLALGISAISVFKDIPPELVDMRRFWTHSLRCAIFAKLIASRCDKRQQERHFVAGLLHDIGKLIMYKKLPYASAQAIVYSRENGVPEFEAEREVLSFDHTHIGALLVREWNFPATLEASLAHHHLPPQDEDRGASIVHLADILSVTAGIAEGAPRVMPQLSHATWDRLGLEAATLRELYQEQDILLQQLVGVLVE